jgi:transcriptional regulator GlxA family with amidase domain
MEAGRQIVEVEGTGRKPRRFVFVLLDNFTMLCFACALEALRIANRMADKELYSWVIAGEGGETARCSAGTVFGLDMDLDELDREDTVLVCGGIDVQSATTKRVLSWLRREARRGAVVGGLCTAGYTLAKAGLLDGK